MNRSFEGYSKINLKFRSSGFEWPLSANQVLIILDTLISTVFCVFTIWFAYSLREALILSIGTILSLLFVVYYWAKTSKLDPTDPVVLANRQAILYKTPFDSSRYQNMCTICNTSVGNNSKHCGSCNRCVHNFDHHCTWLNNCIGHNNYRLFIKLLICTIIHKSFILSSSAVQLVKSSKNDNFRGVHILALQIFLVAQSGVILFLLTNLLGLHFYLYKRGLTTYEFIKQKHLKKASVFHEAGITNSE